MGKKVLVTGANGFAGSYLCRKLAERGDQVLALVRKSSKRGLLDGVDVELVYGDLADAVPTAEQLRGVETVYHIAAVYRTEGVPDQYFYKVNAHGTERLLQSALQADVSRFVHCSTVGVLGKIQHPPATETTPYAPGDIYQKSKLAGELKALEFFDKHNFPGTVVRPAAIYGPGDMRFLKLFRAIDRGTFWMIGRGDVTYHLVYVEDLADGIILAGERPEAVGEIFILGGNEYVKVRDLVAMIADVLGRPMPNRQVPVWPVMLAAQVCQKVCRPLGIEPPLYPRRLDFFVKDRAFDISKARRVLGYNPRVDVKTGLRRTAEWYRAHDYLRPVNVAAQV